MFQGLMLDSMTEACDSLMQSVGISLFDEDIDMVIFRTNEFLTSGGASGGGPFWYIMQMSMTLGAVFAVIMAAGMAYKMMVKNEAFDPLKIIRVFAIACVMFWWYPSGGVLDCLALIPNAIGSWTHDMYKMEALQVSTTIKNLSVPMKQVETKKKEILADYEHRLEMTKKTEVKAGEQLDVPAVKEVGDKLHQLNLGGTYAGIVVFIDKIVMTISLIIFKIGWWGTIYCQQILLGMLTIFGPIQWAFSILPKWEGAWAKWLIRYLTVHFYGAMLYFVGFYVLLLFDIVFSIQCEMLTNILGDNTTVVEYLYNAFLTSGYLLVASMVSMKCLNLVPDLAAWMVPEGDTAFSTRNFGEGVAASVKQSATSAMSSLAR